MNIDFDAKWFGAASDVCVQMCYLKALEKALSQSPLIEEEWSCLPSMINFHWNSFRIS